MATLSRRGVLRKRDIRDANERLILSIVRENDNVSRSDIVRMTGLSASSVTFIVNRLISEGLIEVEDRNVQVQTGRPPIALRLRPESIYAIGAEVSPDGSRVGAADIEGKILTEKKVAWHPNPTVALGRLSSAIQTLISRYSDRRLAGVGVAVPGTVARDRGQVVAAENLEWFDIDAGRILSGGLPVIPVLENDAKLAAFGERWFHAGEPAAPANFVFVTAARGLGTGVVLDGHLLQGASGEGSEFGHTVLYPDGRPCLCGGHGCWEEYASARALERLYAERAPRATVEEIVRRARAGDSAARSSLHETAIHVGLGFVNLRQAFDPEEIVVGNYLAEAWDLIEDDVWKVLRERISSRYLERLRIVPARLTDDSTLIGAAALVLSRYFRTPVATQRALR